MSESETVTETVTDPIIPDPVAEVADSAAEPETGPPSDPPASEPAASSEPEWRGPLTVVENGLAEVREAIAGLSARVPAPEAVAPDDAPRDTSPARKPWTHRGFSRRRNVVE